MNPAVSVSTGLCTNKLPGPVFSNLAMNELKTIEKKPKWKTVFYDFWITDHGSLKTKWFMKSTSSGWLLNYRSQHPFSHIISVIKNLLFRCINLSSPEFQNSNFYNTYFPPLCENIIYMSHQVELTIKRQREGFSKFPCILCLFDQIKYLIVLYNIKIADHFLSL